MLLEQFNYITPQSNVKESDRIYGYNEEDDLDDDDDVPGLNFFLIGSSATRKVAEMLKFPRRKKEKREEKWKEKDGKGKEEREIKEGKKRCSRRFFDN